MGDLQGVALSSGLFRVPKSVFDAVNSSGAGRREKATAFAALARLNALYMIARAGSGHIGTSFSSMDIVTWLYLSEMRHTGEAPDIFFSSKGHDSPALYATLIALGALGEENLDGLRRLGKLPGHPDVRTPGIAFNTGSLGMGVSKAKGVLEADRLNGHDRRIYVMTGDGELQEGQFWESLVGAANREHAALTVIVDHNKFQSDKAVVETSDLGDLEARVGASGWQVLRIDGHDFDALSKALDSARATSDRPSLIIADTLKGRGVSFMEHTALGPDDEFYGFHSGAPSPEQYRQAVVELWSASDDALTVLGLPALSLDPINETNPVAAAEEIPTGRLIPAYTEALLAAAETNPDIVALDADLILDTGLIAFRDTYPDRFIECGIAEQDMVSQAGGLARYGKLPVVHSFACFLSTRPNEQIFNNASEGTKIVYVGSLAGVLPAGPGHSHQSVRDISALNGIPDLALIQPGCAQEVGLALDWAVNDSRNSTYLRLSSIPYADRIRLPGDYTFQPGTGCRIRDGADAALIAYGPTMLNEAISAHEQLAERGIGLSVLNLPWLNRLDIEWLAKAVGAAEQVFTLDDHFLAGGQGEMIASMIAESGIGLRVKRFGLDRLPYCGRNDEVLAAHGLNANSLCNKIEAALEQ